MSRVAVITRTKNRPLMLRRAMESVLAQTFSDWTMVVVNDGGDREAVDALAHDLAARFSGRLKIIHNAESLGMEAASNIGIGGSESEFLVVLDDDDTWEPTFLAVTTAYFNQPLVAEFGGVVTGFKKVVERVEDQKIVIESSQNVSPFMQQVTLWQMCGRNCFPVNAFLYKRSCLDKVGLYREDLPVLGDWDFNLRFLLHYDIGQVADQALANFHHRVHGTESVFSNSYQGSIDKHKVYGTKIKNDWLRRDLQAGKLGLGFAMNLAGQLTDTEEHVEEIRQLVLPFHGISTGFDNLKKRVKGKRP